MKYADLIQFEPVETVIELRQADSSDVACRLVDTFVISERMAEQLSKLVFPQLRFDAASDNKGLLVVGNYGTGKSHLMALISAIAEHAELAKHVTNPAVADAAAPIAGRFQVIRMETSATEMGLRDLVCRQLESRLAKRGVAFKFPDAKQVTSNKEDLEEMMGAFVEVFPAEEAAARDIRRLYRLARETTRGYEGYARMLAKRYDRCPNTLAKVLDGLFHVAASDKAITVHELAFLERVGEIFGLSQLTVRRLKAEHLGLAPGDPSGCWAWPPTPPTRPCARPGSRRCRPATPTARWAAACRRSWSRPPRPRHPRSTPPSTQ